MRVFFIGSKYDGCFYVRCLLPLRERGWWGTRDTLRGKMLPLTEAARLAAHADVVVFHRPDDDARIELMKLLKGAGKKVVFDNDDTYVPASGVPMGKFFGPREAEMLAKWNAKIYEALREADLVTCTTETLAAEYRQVHPNVVVLPNCVDPEDWPEPEDKPDRERLRLGIVGSVASTGDWEVVKPFLERVGSEAQLVVLGLQRRDRLEGVLTGLYLEMHDFFESVGAEMHQPVTNADYPHKLLSLDLDAALIPRTDNYFNRCKSNVKFLEMSMLEIPVIASGFSDGRSPYQGPDEPYMEVCLTLDDWVKAYENLKDVGTRRKMGKAARRYVTKNYNIADKAQLWENEYSRLLASRS
jgi:glycosyltransferase involved in cell wall biosynthesis